MSDVTGGGGEQSLLGQFFGGMSSGAQSQGGVRLNINANPVRELTKSFETLLVKLKDVDKQFKSIKATADQAAASMGTAASRGAGGAGGGTAGLTTSSGTPMLGAPTTSAGGGGAFATMKSAFSAMGGGGAAAGAVGAAIGGGVNKAFQTIDNRLASGRDYSLSADRMNMLYQQMTGMSQVQVQNAYRQPLTNYRIGMGGINTLLGLQSTTGINAMQQAPSVEALRTYTGFSLSTEGAAGIMQNLAQPEVANRMFMMMGGGLIGPGGKQNDMQSVLERIVKTAGLTNPALLKGAMAPGSLTRSRLTMMGVSPELQDIALQYANQNQAYQAKGGKGMYDASSPTARKLMGVEDNFATQAEETERTRMQREEQFYSRQADNYADLEQQTQKLVKAFGKLEDTLSGIIGAKASAGPWASIGKKVGGVAAMVGGAALIAGSGGTLTPLAAMLIGGGGALATSGDPPENSKGKGRSVGVGRSLGGANDSTIKVPTYSGMKTLDEVKSFASFKGMHPQLQERVLDLMRANPAVGFGQGFRSYEDQKAMFLSRYAPDPNGEIEWNGQRWKHVSGAPAAPPGRSMHGIGLAADLMGDTAWVAAHSQEFNLVNFSGVNGEPWHVQPSELPNGYTDYVNSGAPWGTGPGSPGETAPTTVGHDPKKKDIRGGKKKGTPSFMGDGGGGGGSYMSIAARVAMGVSSLSGVGGGEGGGKGKGKGGKSSSGGGTNYDLTQNADGALAGETIAKMLWDKGFRGKDLIKMTAIAQRESGRVPTKHNGNTGTGDDSWGLFQLNMLGDLKNWYHNNGVTNPEDLLDPMVNVQMARKLFEANQQWFDGNGFYAWGDYPGSGPGSSDGHLDIPQATQWVQNAQLGDPPAPSMSSRASLGGGTSNMHIGGSHTFNFHVTINANSTSDTDLQQVAKKIADMTRKELKVSEMRSR